MNPDIKTTLTASRSSPVRKLITCFLIATGIWPSVKKKRVFLQVFFHIIFVLCVLKSISCLHSAEAWKDLYGGLLFNNLMTVILWWNLYLKRNEILNLSSALLTTCGTRTERKIVKTVVLTSLLLYSPLILLIFKLSKQSFYYKTRRAYSCQNYWIPTSYMDRLWPVVFIIDISNFWVSFSPFYVSGTIYCIFCFLALAKNRDVAVSSPALERRETLVAFVRKIEKTLSFSIFLVIIRIGLIVFVEVSLYAGQSNTSWISNGFSSLQVFVWFIIIVVLADKVQERCLQDLERCYFSLLGGSKALQVYFGYKNVKKNSVLTAWKLCVIDRRLVLTFIATVITYSVVISGFKS